MSRAREISGKKFFDYLFSLKFLTSRRGVHLVDFLSRSLSLSTSLTLLKPFWGFLSPLPGLGEDQSIRGCISCSLSDHSALSKPSIRKLSRGDERALGKGTAESVHSRSANQWLFFSEIYDQG